MIAFIASWFIAIFLYGKYADHTHYGSSNAIETMLVHDTWYRLTSSSFEGGQPSDYLFFVEVLDVRFNLWNYIFYLVTGMGLYLSLRRKINVLSFLKQKENSLLLFSLCQIIPLSLLLTVATYKYDWYLAPIFFFVACFIAFGILSLSRKWRPFRIITATLLIFTLFRNGYYINGEASAISQNKTKNISAYAHKPEFW